MTESETFLAAFHGACPGVTSRAFARGGSYERLAAQVPSGRVLDVACGDGHLLRILGDRAFGVDLSAAELARCKSRVVQGRAQELPFADASFGAATCHLAFMLFSDLEGVVDELARVLMPGAPFLALVGGGPTGSGSDAFHAFARLLAAGPALGDRRASSEAGWHELFGERAWRDVSFERWELDLSGSFDEVWELLGSSYQLVDDDRDGVRSALREQLPDERVECRVASYCARVTRR